MAEVPKAWPARCPQPLEAVQELLIDYLSSGQGYDDDSVASAVAEGNDFFQRKEFSRACASFGIAYEIGRHHYAYRPLLHDLLLRRILCHSLLGNFDLALQEIVKADWLIPHQATLLVISGMIHSKLGMMTEANSAFQQAVALQRDLKDFVDAMVAFFWLHGSNADRAIRICTQVLQRSPKCPFALLIRGDAYKFGLANTQANRRNAAMDYADLLELDLGYQALIGRQMADASHTRADELLLSFHPTLQMQGPKAYHQYTLCRRKDPFLVASLVVLAVCKLRLLSSSGQVLRKVQEAYEELLEQRAELQRKVHFLLHSQRQVIASPLANQVYGPIDPENPHCRRYRRYWMEQPPPARQVEPPKDQEGPPSLRRRQAVLLAQQDAEAEYPRQRPAVFRDNLRAPAAPAAPAPAAPSAPAVVAQPAPKPLEVPEVSGGTAGDREPPKVPAVSSCPEKVEYRDPEVQDLEVDQPALLPSMQPQQAPKGGPRTTPIQGWSDEQWLMKAQDLLKTYGIDTSPATLSAKETRKEVPVPPPSAGFFSTGPGLKSNKLIEKLDEHGLNYLQDWYTPLDRVHKVRDLAICRASVEPPVAVSGLLGVPGHSYVVPRASLSRASSEERRSRMSARRQ